MEGEAVVHLTEEELLLEAAAKRRFKETGEDVGKARADVDKARADVDKAREDVDKAREDMDNARAKLRKWDQENVDDIDGCRPLEGRLDKAEESLKTADALLQNATQRLEKANNLLNDAERRWKDAQERIEPASKKARHGCYEFEKNEAVTLIKRIRECNAGEIFEIETVVNLPFPSLSETPNRFRVTDGSFQYQSRSDLKCLHEKVVKFWKGGTPTNRNVKVAGTIGYGKSHMLAALVLLLLKEPPVDKYESMPFVCYIPDCRALLGGEDAVVTALKQNILLNDPKFTGALDTIQDIREVMIRKKVILVADQWNSIDNDACLEAKKLLVKCLGATPRVTIHGISMNSKILHDLSNKQFSDDRNFYYGGFNDEEFRVWLHRHPSIFDDHKEELSLLTGKVPLLLSAFARSYDTDASWELILQRAQEDSIVKDWKGMLTRFYKDVDSDQVWKVFTLSVDWQSDESIIDSRFFYEDSMVGFCATSEIVLRLLYRVWSKKGADALLGRWTDLLDKTRNRSSLGFYVEEIIKAQICCHGVIGFCTRPTDKVINRQRFKRGAEQFALDTAIQNMNTNSWWILLDPVIFNYPGVDMILITDKTIVGINVTIAKTHSSLKPFFDIWRPLAEAENMSIVGLFIAPEGFHHEEEHVEIVMLKVVFSELWEKIKSEKQVPTQGHACHCKTGCSTNRCGCYRCNKPCNSGCKCCDCRNTTSSRI